MSFSDQPHIERIRDALWSRPGTGASVMVGSGFSRCANKVRSGVADSPLWQDLATEVTNRLYPIDSLDDESATSIRPSSTDDFLRIAQEYETAFGRTDLHRFLLEQTRNDDFAPGDLHERLLRLPWRDVFTTNWDTLLERARPKVVERGYHAVENVDQIPLANQPRVVKLHGSLPAQFPLIFTEEDYRTYPTKYALFVNTVQQAMMESVLCLIGFSGNAPNFLHWSGWVRDHLGKAAPRIYLCGWFGLSPYRRRMLEDTRGVVPVDLAHHPQAGKWPEHLRHRYAIEWLMFTLERGQPYDATEWPSPRHEWSRTIPGYLYPVKESTSDLPEPEPENNAETRTTAPLEFFRKTISIWKKNRLLYPGWLVFPSGDQREELSWRTDDGERQFLTLMDNISLPERLEFIRELVWRREILLQPISRDLEDAADHALRSINCHERTIERLPSTELNWENVREAWRSVALTLLTSARFQHDGELFDQRIEALKQFIQDSDDVYHRVRHELCLWAVNSLDFHTLESRLAEWSIEDCDPAWMVRKAALLYESVKGEEAYELVKRAMDSIRTSRRSDRDIASASLEGWALCSAVTLESWRMCQKRWDELSQLKCDAWSEKDLIHRRLSSESEKRESPNFDLGRRRQTRLTFTNASPWRAAYRAIRLSEIAGLPHETRSAGIGGVDVARRMLGSAATNISDESPEFAVHLVLRTSSHENDPTLQAVVTRNRLAILSADSAKALAADCINLIEYGLSNGRVEQTRASMEVLSRLVLRLETDQALEIFDKSMAYYADRQNRILSHPWLSEPVWNLMRRSWDAIPPHLESQRILGVLSAPIVGLDGFEVQIESRHPDPGNLLDSLSGKLLPERNAQNEESWQLLSSLLTRGLIAGGEARRRAATRLDTLRSPNQFAPSELSRIGNALWSDKHTPQDGLPAGTDLYDWAFLVYPEPQPGIAEKRFRLKWFSTIPISAPDTGSTEGDTVAFSLGHRADNQNSLEDTIWNIGAALSVCADHGRPFGLTEGERERIIHILTVWSKEGAFPRKGPLVPDASRRPTILAIEGIALILRCVAIPEEVGEHLYAKLKDLTEAGIPALKPIGELARILPSRIGDMVFWLRSALSSQDREAVVSALSCLVSWIGMQNEEASGGLQPPSDVFREVGVIIAARNEVALPLALEVAALAFSKGTEEIREPIKEYALQGLAYLSEELRYDRIHSHTSEVPLLRMRCGQLALAMSKCGLADHPSVARWLEDAASDPFPEIRYSLLVGSIQ